MNQQLFSNRTSGVVLTAAIATTGALSLSVSAASAALFPALANGDYFDLYLTQAGAVESSYEVVRATSVNTGTGVVTLSQRAIEGTAATWAIGDKCEIRATSRFMNAQNSQVGRSLQPLSLIGPIIPNKGVGSFNPLSYTKTKAALNAVLNGTGDIKIGLNGDSTVMGVGAGNVSVAGNRLIGPIESLTRALNSIDIPASCMSFDGDSNYYVTTGGASTGGNATGYQTFDTRVNPGAGGWVETVAQTAGGAYFQNTTTTNPLTFYNAGWPGTDTCVVRYKTGPSATPFNIARSGWTTQLVTPILTDGMASITLTGPASVGGVSITPTTIGTVEILGMEVWDSTIKRARMHSIGWSGGMTSNWISTGNGANWNPLPALLNMNFDLIIGQFGINEWGNSVPVATFKANLITWVTSNLTNGSEIILVTPYPSALSVAAYATCKTYVDAIYEVAGTYNLLVIDVWRKVGSQDGAALYSLYFDSKHPRNPLYQNTMEGIANVIRQLVVL